MRSMKLTSLSVIRVILITDLPTITTTRTLADMVMYENTLILNST
jgi:hypothetical protein